MSDSVFYGSANYPAPSPRPVVTIGNFDGVHRGHRALIGRVIERARELGRPSCVYTFDPSPVEVLRPDRRGPKIQDLNQRIAMLQSLGIDHVVVEVFDTEFAAHEADWFAREILARRLGASAIVVGWDFRFGKDRAGSVDSLSRWLAVDVESFGPFLLEGEAVSSSRIRALVAAGAVEQAEKLLGRPHRVTGRVIRGDGRGRTIGFPTANIESTTELLPGIGVYAVWCEAPGVGKWPAVVNLGERPTFNRGGVSLEAHLLGWSGDLYGMDVALDFIGRIRGEERFPSVDALVERIGIDVRIAEERLAVWAQRSAPK